MVYLWTSMSRQNLRLLLVFLLTFTLPILCFAEYKVVIKKNGKILEGKLLSDTDTSITIVSGGAQLTFQKAALDLEKMKELNADYHSKSEAKTIEFHGAPRGEEQKDPSPLTQIAKMSEDARKQGEEETKQPVDANEKAFVHRIADLEKQSKRMDVSQAEQQFSMVELLNAKKALASYRSRNTPGLSKDDQILMLEQLIKALESELETQKHLGISDETMLNMRRNIQDKQEELSKLQR
jgi:hypothetical protein